MCNHYPDESSRRTVEQFIAKVIDKYRKCDYASSIPVADRPNEKGKRIMVRFNKHHVTDGTNKARVHYSLDNRTDGRPNVTLYAKDYAAGDALYALVGDAYTNDSDLQSDYFDKGRAVLFAGHPLYAAARARAEQDRAERAARYATKAAA